MRKTYKLICFIVRTFIMRLYARYHLYHEERIQDARGCIIAVNHISNFDPPFIGSVVPFEIYYFGKAELFKVRWFGAILKYINVIPVHRGQVTAGSITQASKILTEGHSLLLFPEGTRRGLRAKPGVGLLALQLQKDIVPIYIRNSDRLWECFTGRCKLTITIGEKIRASSFSEMPKTKESYQAIADLIFNKIQELEQDDSIS